MLWNDYCKSSSQTHSEAGGTERVASHDNIEICCMKTEGPEKYFFAPLDRSASPVSAYPLGPHSLPPRVWGRQ